MIHARIIHVERITYHRLTLQAMPTTIKTDHKKTCGAYTVGEPTQVLL